MASWAEYGRECPARKRTGNGQGEYCSLGFSAPISRGSGQPLAERDVRQVHPVVLGDLTNEHQVANFDASALVKLCPTRPGHAISMLGLVFGAHLHNGQMRHVGPLLIASQAINI